MADVPTTYSYLFDLNIIIYKHLSTEVKDVDVR